MLVGGSTSPSEKYAHQIGSFPHIGMNIEIFELPLPSLFRVCWSPPFLGSTGIFKEAGRIPEVFEKNLGKERVAPVSGCQTKIIHPPTTVAFTKKHSRGSHFLDIQAIP